MRLPKLEIKDLSEEQSRLLDDIQSGPRKDSIGNNPFGGPFGVWIRTPTLGNAIQSLGSTIRFKTSIPDDIREIVICTVGIFYQSEFEVAIHKEIALKSGVEAESLEKLCKGTPSGFTGAAAMAHQITVEMLGNHKISEKTYQAASVFFTPEKMMELVATVGYYCLVSHTLNAFEIPLNDNMVSPFK